MLMLPMLAKADSLNFNLAVGTDDEAHYHFSDTQPSHHHSEIWKTAMKLRDAKHRIWEARKHRDFGGHAESSIQAINTALDELRLAEDYVHSH
jgi:hypothetical protein